MPIFQLWAHKFWMYQKKGGRRQEPLWSNPSYGRNGVRWPFKEDDLMENLIFEAENWSDLDYLLLYLEEDLSRGVIDEQGRFWGGDIEGLKAALISQNVVAKNELEESWVFVDRENWPTYWWLNFNTKEPNDAQSLTLINIGLDPYDRRSSTERVEFTDLYPNGYDHHPSGRPVPAKLLTPEESRKKLGLPVAKPLPPLNSFEM